jgi:hypothetical protein
MVSAAIAMSRSDRLSTSPYACKDHKLKATKMADDESDWMPYPDVVAHVEAIQHCYRERAIALVWEAIVSSKVKSRTVSDSPYYIESELPGTGEIYFSSYGRGIEVLREDVLREWPEHPRPPSVQPASKVPLTRPRPIEEGVIQAILDLWPNGLPVGLRAKDRNNQILARLKKNEASVPTDVSKAVQRALKAIDKRGLWTGSS